MNDTLINLDNFESINQIHAGSRTSDKYKFIPTTRALAVLADHGWMPVKAMQSKTRIEENKGFQRHAIRLMNTRFNKELSTDRVIPQILLTNSHCGTSSFKLQLAAHVFLCSNGLVRASGVMDEIRVKHIGYEDLNISEACEQLMIEAPKMMHEIEGFRSTTLSRYEQIAYASSAIETKFDGEKYIVDPASLIRPYRREEQDPTLWNTFNIVQEKLIKGGVRQRRSDGSSIRSRRVQNITEDIRLNKVLWSLTQRMQELKQGVAN